MTTMRKLPAGSREMHQEDLRASQTRQQAEARAKAWQAALSKQWQPHPERTPAATVLQCSLRIKGRRIFTIIAGAETLGPDTFIEDLDAEDFQERIAFTGEFSLRINRQLSDRFAEGLSAGRWSTDPDLRVIPQVPPRQLVRCHDAGHSNLPRFCATGFVVVRPHSALDPEVCALILDQRYKDGGHACSILGWALRNSSGVSEGVHHSVVQSEGQFLRVGVAGRHREIFRRQPEVPTHQGDGVHESR